MTDEFGAFLGVSAIVIVTPGQDTALTVKNTLAGGRRGGVFTALGVISGQAVWAVAASAGLAAVLVASEPAFIALKVVGAAYLVYLGLEALLAAIRGRRRANAAGLAAPAAPYRQGLVSNLGNPKMAVFFTSLLPQFTTAFAAMLALGFIFCAMTLVWLSSYAWVISRAADHLRHSRLLDALMGSVLVALGLRLASTER
jgi:threonine/homoserine/homoserine lactone efflux protein